MGFSPPGIWEFSSLYSNQGGGADYTHLITACPPRFENLAASLQGLYHVVKLEAGKNEKGGRYLKKSINEEEEFLREEWKKIQKQ